MNILKGMRSFVAVVDQEGFTAAGRTLGLSKSMVSKQISMLEDHLGCRLLNRTTRRHSLTEAGHLYLEHCKSILDQNSGMEDVLGERSAEPRGTLRVNAPVSYGRLFIAPLMGEFLDRYPSLRTDLVLSDQFSDIIEEGYDVAVRIGGDTPPSLMARKIDQTRHSLYASPNWLATNGHPKTKEDLSAHRCLVYSQGGQRRQWRLGGETVSPDWSFACNNGDVLRRVALDHSGLVYLPEFFIKRDLEQGTLVRIDDPYPEDAQPILAVFPHRRHLPLKVRVFVDFLIERL
ncbi:MAG: LysR family transcriptional regulator [Candidatus Hydrogenedentes bacterium]|nr:LysR family transcriptional regulator [Candidatus Hydrogenedentota bacterium]